MKGKLHKTLYPNLKAEMFRKGYTARDIMQALGVKANCAYRLRRAERRISISRALIIRDKLFSGMTIEYLFAPGE